MKKLSILLIIAIMIFSACEQEAQETYEETVAPVEIRNVKLDSIDLVTTFTGRVQSDDIIPVIVQTPGEVERVYVSNGDYVKKDQKLFSLVATNISRQLEQAQAAYDSAVANYELTKEQIEAAVANYEKMKKLYQAGAISKSQLDQAELSASKYPLEAAKGSVDQAKVALNNALDLRKDTVVKAPRSGIVSSLEAKENSFISNTQPAMLISDNLQLNIVLNVSENYINKIKKDDDVGIYIPATKYNYDGKINTLSTSLDPNSLLYPIEIKINSVDDKIKNGMIAEVEIITESKEQVLVVPAQAVLLRGDREVVFIYQDGIAVQREVETGIDDGTNIEIKSGVKLEEDIVVLGQNFISDGDKIKIVGGE